MIDLFTIFNKRGVVLFSYPKNTKLPGAPVDRLVKDVLLEERSGENSYSLDNYALKWTFANEFDLIFVAVYQKIFTLLYLEELLEIVKRQFSDVFKALIAVRGLPPSSIVDTVHFEDKFNAIMDEVESTSKKRPIKQKKWEETQKAHESGRVNRRSHGNEKDTLNTGDGGDEGKEKEEKRKKPPATAQDPALDGLSEVERNRLKFIARQQAGPRKKDAEPPKELAKRTKKPRSWDSNAATGEERKKLNFGQDTSSLDDKIDVKQLQYRMDEFDDTDDESDVDEDVDVEEEPEEEATTVVNKPANSSSSSSNSASPARSLPSNNNAAPSASKSSFGFFGKYLSSLTGNRVLEADELAPILAQFKTHLMEKNVASEIADKLCQSVGASLEGKKLATFQSIKKTVTEGLEEALTRILTPKRQIDILHEVAQLRKARPYTIVFCGVNGVGKSTNLAKVASWLITNGLKVMIAACDTFRSGAVEQLHVHSRRLGVPVFERGYDKDAAGIAAEAIQFAKADKFDVVLVDTAGRMQDKEPLMRALAKLVNTNPIDLVLFVGEALVGNDGVDQLVKFNQALTDLSTTNPPRSVDGIILTKFDTVDSKVGAAISMVYSTGQPIVFLGTGQQYTDLKRLNVAHTVKTLLK